MIPMLMKRSVESVALILFPLPLQGGNLSGAVVGVIDGDTIEVLRNQGPERVRLHDIDCPEKGQAFGQRANQATSTAVFG